MSRLLSRLFRNGLAVVNESPVRLDKATEDLIQQKVWATLFGPAGNLSNETDEIRQRYREILREPVVKAALLLKVWGVASLELEVQAADPENGRDETIAEFQKYNLTNCVGGLRALIEAILFGCLIDGYGLCHKRERVEDRGKWAGKIVLDCLRPKDSQYFDLDFDDFLNIRWVIDLTQEDESKRKLPPDQFVIIRHLQIFDSPYGMSDFRAADRAYCCKDAATKLRMIYLDKYIGPFLVGKCNGDENAAMDAALQAGRAGGWIRIDPTSEVEVKSLALGSDEAFKSAIADFNEEMAVGMTGAFLQMLAGQVPGGRGSSSEHGNSFETFIWYLADLACTTADSQIIRKSTDDNFSGSPAYPKTKLVGVNPGWVRQDLELAQLKLDMGGSIDEAELDKRSTWGPGELRKAPMPDPFADLNDNGQEITEQGKAKVEPPAPAGEESDT